jgi:hypothetical protein
VLVNGGALRGDRTDITFTPATRDEARLTLEALMGARGRRAPNFVVDDLIRVCRHGPLGRLSQTSAETDAAAEAAVREKVRRLVSRFPIYEG